MPKSYDVPGISLDTKPWVSAQIEATRTAMLPPWPPWPAAWEVKVQKDSHF